MPFDTGSHQMFLLLESLIDLYIILELSSTISCRLENFYATFFSKKQKNGKKACRRRDLNPVLELENIDPMLW